MNTFIRAVEYWVPGEDGSLLEFGAGLYGTSRHFEALSRELCFGRGEGLPGHAWEAGHPIVLKSFEGSYFRRTSEAHAVGINCGIAIPMYTGDKLSSVLVLFCGEDTSLAGAIELWHANPAVSPDMTLVDGHYGNTGDAFEFISRSTVFRKGTGLPGQAWAAQKPVFLPDLGRSSGFLRADSAQKVGINRGLAIPYVMADGSVYVLTFLSALATPIARRVEIWQPGGASHAPQLSAGFCEVEGALVTAAKAVIPLSAEVPVKVALATALPVVRKRDPSAALANPVLTTDGPLVALPVLFEGQVTAVVALYL